MTWNPNCTVTVDGVDYSSKTINSVSVTYGRTSYWEQARTGYSTVEIVNWDDSDYAFEINDSVVITVDNASAVARTVFTGKVTNITSRMVAVGSVEEVAVITLTAVGPFAAMSRKIIGTSAYSKELDSDRMSQIFTDAGVTVDVVDTPGIYEFTSKAAAPLDAYASAAKYASMANGYIYETATGEVGFANQTRRRGVTNTVGYKAIPENYILWKSVSSAKSLGDILNEIRLSYKANAVVTASDATSQGLYGLLGAQINTELELMSDAQELADKYIALRRLPRLNMSSFTIPLDSPNVSSSDLDIFLQITMDTAISISGLPVPLMPSKYFGFVEGWNLQVTRNQSVLTLITSNSIYSNPPTRWEEVDPPTLTWNTVSSTLQWELYD